MHEWELRDPVQHKDVVFLSHCPFKMSNEFTCSVVALSKGVPYPTLDYWPLENVSLRDERGS